MLFDPLPAGTYTGTGLNAVTVENDGGRNGARGPGFFQADVRLGYRFRFGQRRLEVFGEVFNLTDRANFELAAADRRSDQLPHLHGAARGRRATDGPVGHALHVLSGEALAARLRV